MSEKQVKRARMCAKLGYDKVVKIGGRRWLQADDSSDWPDAWRFQNGAQLRFMTEPPRTLQDRLVGSGMALVCDPELAYLAANRCGKTFACAGLEENDEGEVVVVDPYRLLGIERKDSE